MPSPTPPLNRFEDAIEAALVQVLLQNVSGSCLNVVPGETPSVQVVPRIDVITRRVEEAVFQSGIYEAEVELAVHGAVDGESGPSVDEARANAALFAGVMDVLQTDDLQTQLEATTKVTLKGITPGTQNPAETDERSWVKRVTWNFIGWGNGAS